MSAGIDVLVLKPYTTIAERHTIVPNLDAFQTLVGGGYIEALNLTDEVGAYINEDGKSLRLDHNYPANRVVMAALKQSGRTLIPGDYIAGPLVLTGMPDDEGETTGVPESVIELLTEAGVTIGKPGDNDVRVTVPDKIESKVTGRERRSLTSELDTSIDDAVKLQITTSHSKDRKQFSTWVVGVRHMPRAGLFTSSKYSLMDSKTVYTEPTPRFAMKALEAAHQKALGIVSTVLDVDPDAFTAILRKTPQR